jgi:pimeloyl-ACP methyl ester carboxylesterase
MTSPQTKTLNVNGINLAYNEWEGEKGPLFCLSSISGHKGSFANIAQQLAPEYRLFAIDLRGRGDSDKPLDGYGFSYHARDILAFADALGFEKFSLIGHSFGGTVSVYIASIRPSRIKATVLIDGGCDPKEEVLEAMRPVLRRLAKVYPSMYDYLRSMRLLPYFINQWSSTLENYLRDDVEIFADGTVRSKASADAVERDLDVHFYYSMCVHFPTMQCPTLFIRPKQGLLGDTAHVLDEKEAAAFVAWIPDCERVDLFDVNHYTMVLHDTPPVISPIQKFLRQRLV